MEIKRDKYLKQLIDYQWDGQVKVITGIRRCGKSYLLRTLFKNYLLESGVREEHILSFELDLAKDIRFRNPLELSDHVRNHVDGKPDNYYLFIDEIQMSDEVANPYNPTGKPITFYDALNDLKSLSNLDVYVTGSNSKMLSKDILSEFRGRSDEIRVHPFSFAEFYSAVGGDKNEAFDTYAFYGGMPLVLSRPTDTAKMNYLQSLFSEVFIKDIVERKKIERQDILEQIIDLLCSSIGSLTNPGKITNTMKSKNQMSMSPNTVKAYIDHLKDAFLFAESKRYDVRGKSYFDFPNKYYCEDIGLRNARIGFRQQEMTHIMENILYNELIIRGYAVDVGIVFSREQNKNGNSVRVSREIDFIATLGNRKVYIQSAYAMPTEEKLASEIIPFSLTGDSFPKIVVRKDISKRWYDDNGILNIGLIDFLLDESVI
ncbi:ATP-binding protein [Sedimentibacter hydroxybenzoicus DSM 7310]|uniref:ATP-binding protein n=1 Tax=Sedimentibacter hydroxybenzoicus DSM 7310 TaxID=1123245 RepID=A0A974GW64_SEDHY|nr:ATP-binding protein [Sedimentibacter hydroxybenzoicus]NYB73735.1 ATP-binding protein [Sedimentibacter hydroxybenzoicus DSM 7310]